MPQRFEDFHSNEVDKPKCVRIIPKNGYFFIDVIYEVKEKSKGLDGFGIDLKEIKCHFTPEP